MPRGRSGQNHRAARARYTTSSTSPTRSSSAEDAGSRRTSSRTYRLPETPPRDAATRRSPVLCAASEPGSGLSPAGQRAWLPRAMRRARSDHGGKVLGHTVMHSGRPFIGRSFSKADHVATHRTPFMGCSQRRGCVKVRHRGPGTRTGYSGPDQPNSAAPVLATRSALLAAPSEVMALLTLSRAAMPPQKGRRDAHRSRTRPSQCSPQQCHPRARPRRSLRLAGRARPRARPHSSRSLCRSPPTALALAARAPFSYDPPCQHATGRHSVDNLLCAADAAPRALTAGSLDPPF